MSKETMKMTSANNGTSSRLSACLRRLGRSTGFAALACLAFGVGASSALAAPKLDLKVDHTPSYVAEGEVSTLELVVSNIGDTPTTGPITVDASLPPGVTAVSVTDQVEQSFGQSVWACSIAPGGGSVDCEGPDPAFFGGALASIPPYGEACRAVVSFLPCRILLDVEVAPGSSDGLVEAKACGGEAPACAFASDPLPVGASSPGFSLLDWDGPWTVDEDEEPFTQAGGHPYSVVTTFKLSKHIDETNQAVPDGSLRNLRAKLPAGFVGAPNAMPTCESIADLAPVDLHDPPNCPVNSIVGTISLQVSSEGQQTGWITVPIFNMKPPPGVPAQFGFNVLGFAQWLNATVRSDGDYGININVRNASQGVGVSGVTTRFWGVPADPSHDSQRCRGGGALNASGSLRCAGAPGDSINGPNTASVGTPKAFLTNPTSCTPDGVGKEIPLEVESWELPSRQGSGSFVTHEPGDRSAQVGNDGCDVVPFSPDITIQPSSRRTDTPSGIEVNLTVPQEGLNNPTGIAQSALKKAVVALPEGMTVNPSFTDGVEVCTPGQIGLVSTDPPRFDLAPDTCPEASKIGAVQIDTPLLDVPLEGSLIAAQSNDGAVAGHENPFDSLVALYIVAEGAGVRVKLPGEVALNEATGQLVTTFDNNPQVPFSRFTLSFKGGPRAPLVTPSSCGTYTSTAQLSPWARPDQPFSDSDPFVVNQGPDGGSCATSGGARPFNPVLRAGTLNNNAGSYSPFVLRMSRNDGEQEITSFRADLPPGLVAKLAGTSRCPNAALAMAAAKTGKAEKASPSCPASSRIGTALSGSGSGQILTYVPGSVYLAGPYNGAPLSVATVVPAAVGPFDIGTIVVRAALRIDGDDAQAHVDPVSIPYIRSGIALHVRDIRVILDRDNFSLNPTSCEPTTVTAQMLGTGADFASPADDVVANLSERFQAANCAALPFKPKLSFKLKGGTKRGQFPAFQAVLKARPGDANIAGSTVVLPRSEFIEQGHIRTVCTRVQFAANQCPPGSIYGYAKATTPLFDKPLEGPVYLRSNGGERVLPDLVVSLNGEIDVALTGFVDSVKGRVRNRFAVIPDAPVTKFVLNMQGGKKGLLVNHLDLCEVTSRADVKLIGQNGKVVEARPKMGTSCKANRKAKRNKRNS